MTKQVVQIPQADRIEEDLIGAVLTSGSIEGDTLQVRPATFRQIHLRPVWKAILDLHSRGDPIDIELVAHVLDVEGKLDKCGPGELTMFIKNCPNASHAEAYARQVLDSAMRRGFITAADKVAKLSTKEGDPFQLFGEAEQLIRTYKRRAGAIKAEGIKGIYSADEILAMDFPEPTWAIPEILPVGLSILAGKSKVGKSWMMLQIALAVGSGGYVLDKRVDEGPVLYLALEDSLRRIKNRMQKINWEPGLPVEIMPMGLFQDEFGFLENGGGERLAERIRDRGYRTVMIDTFSRAISVDQNDRQPVDMALIPLHEMAHEHECCVMLADHHNKTNFKNPDAVIDILGSTAKGANSDTIWGLYRQRGVRGGKLQVTGRDIDEVTLQLMFDKQTACWQSLGEIDEDQIEITPNRYSIIETVRAHGGMNGTELARVLGRARPNVLRDMAILIDAGYIVRDSDKTYHIYDDTHDTHDTYDTQDTQDTLEGL